MKKPVHLEDRAFDGARQFSPTAARNSGPIASQLAPRLNTNDSILGIASGTGQQAMAILEAKPDITWQPSDPNAQARASLATYVDDQCPSLLPPLDIDVTRSQWWTSLPGEYNHIFCANMIHIAPSRSVHGLASGAQQILPAGGHVYLYGPFLYAEQSAQSNLEFNERLKKRDPDWGVRELDFVKPIFASCGLTLSTQIAMPSNNHILEFTRL